MSGKSTPVEDDDPLDRELDFSHAIPNPFARDYGRNRNLRILDPDLLAVFPDSESMNEALRTLIRLMTNAPSEKSAQSRSASKPKKPTSARSRG
jgi:hypothetical protein